MSERMDADSRQPYLTGTIPGIGGSIKESPEDFLVEEIPSYVPAVPENIAT